LEYGGERLHRFRIHSTDYDNPQSDAPPPPGIFRSHLRGRNEILKRLLTRTAAINVALLVRILNGIGKHRALQRASPELLNAHLSLWLAVARPYAAELVEHANLDAADGVAA
jgi:hypothetical protein